MVRKKKLEEYEKRIAEAMNMLGMVSEDTTTPRNISLDEILQDPNMPPYTRVKLWNVMSLLEAIKD